MFKAFWSALLLLCCTFSIAQDFKMKFGDISDEHLQMTHYVNDSTASALILGDAGTSEIKYDQNRGFYLLHTNHTRIKILSTDGFNYADVAIPLYHQGSSSEDLGSFRAATYNLNGRKTEESKLKRRDTFTEKSSENWDHIKFTLPDVKVGSVIEYEYSVRSDYFFNLQDWTFQHDIPALWSDYEVMVPQYFRYEKLIQGAVPMVLSETGSMQESLSITTKNRTGGNSTNLVVSTGYQTDKINYVKNVYHWRAVDIPAFREEPYMSSTKNYISKVTFELEGVFFPGSAPQVYMGSWNDINRAFLDHDGFGKRLNGSRFLNDEVEKIMANTSKEEEVIAGIYDYVKRNVKWNGYYGRYASRDFKTVLEEGEGNVADINLLLVNMLKKAGIEASPVLISTRNNGFVRLEFPLSSQFNYVIAEAKVGDKSVLLDATDRALPIGLLPVRALNEQGARVSEGNPGWVTLSSPGTDNILVSAELEVMPEGKLKGVAFARYSDYSARSIRSKLSSEEEEFKSTIEKENEWEIDSFEVQNQEDISKPLTINFNLETSKGVESLGDMIYLSPFIAEHLEENPFKREIRAYPVDFVVPSRSNYMVTITVPEGYEIAELPASGSFALPENKGIFRFYSQVMENKINIRCQLNINQALFTSIEYPGLRAFFSRVVQKEGEQIVLKKITEED